MKKNIHEIINNKEFETAIRVPLFFSVLISLMDISIQGENILWDIDWIGFIKTFGLCIYSTVFPNICIELFSKNFSKEKFINYLFLLIFALICLIFLMLTLVLKKNCLIVISSLASIPLLLFSSYCFYPRKDNHE